MRAGRIAIEHAQCDVRLRAPERPAQGTAVGVSDRHRSGRCGGRLEEIAAEDPRVPARYAFSPRVPMVAWASVTG